MRALVAISPKRGTRIINLNGAEKANGGEQEDGSEEEGEDWSDIDSILNGDDEDEDDEEYEDDWSEEDDVPPDFDDDGDTSVKVGSKKPARKVEAVTKKEESQTLVFPDGRPRERW